MLREIFRSVAPRSEKKSRTPQRQRHTRLFGESLESRTVLSASYSLALGTLTITTDNTDNDIEVAQTATPGRYIISVAALPDVTEVGVHNIVLNTGRGDNSVDFFGATPAPATGALSGNLTINATGSFPATESIGFHENFAVKGQVKITDIFPNEELNVSAVKNNVSGDTAPPVFGSLVITGSTGRTNINLSNMTVRGPATIILGGGTNHVQIGGLIGGVVPPNLVAIGGNLSITGGTQTNEVEVSNAIVNGNVSVSFKGTGADVVELMDGVSIGGSLWVTAPKNALTVEIDQTVVHGTTTIDAHASLQDAHITIDDSVFRRAFTLTTGAGNDTFRVEPVSSDDGVSTQFFGVVTVKMGAGDNTVKLGTDDTSLAIFYGFASFDLTALGAVQLNQFDASFAEFFGGHHIKF